MATLDTATPTMDSRGPLGARERRLLNWGRTRYPLHVNIEPTTQCNLKCLHCLRTFWKERDQYRDIDVGLYKKTLVELREMGVRGITIQGLGEPLLHPNIFEMIAYAQELGFYTRFNTNLTILDDETADRLVRSGHSEIMVSIESIDPELYADIRRKGELQDVLTNMQRVFDAKKRLNARAPEVHVNAVLLKSTLHLASRLVREMKALGVSRLNFQGLNTVGLAPEAHLHDGTRMVDSSLNELPAAEIERVTRELLNQSGETMVVSVASDIGGRGSQALAKDTVMTCHELWDSPYIDSAGCVTPCCWLPDGSIMNLGDLKKVGFRDVWQGDAYTELRRQHVTGQHPKQCRDCQALTVPVSEIEAALLPNTAWVRVRRRFSVGKLLPKSVKAVLRKTRAGRS